MSIIKKMTLIFSALLFVALSACQNDLNGDSTTSPTEQTATATQTEYATEDTSTETLSVSNATSIAGSTETTAISTVISWPMGGIKQKELTLFFETYQQTMLELTKPLMDKKMQSATISTGYNEIYYVDETGDRVLFDDGLREKFKDYLTVAEAETRSFPRIDLKTIDGKRLIKFGFSTEDTGGSITYMPDGYVEYKMLYSDIDVGEYMQKSEIKLADNWYCYYG